MAQKKSYSVYHCNLLEMNFLIQLISRSESYRGKEPMPLGW